MPALLDALIATAGYGGTRTWWRTHFNAVDWAHIWPDGATRD